MKQPVKIVLAVAMIVLGSVGLVLMISASQGIPVAEVIETLGQVCLALVCFWTIVGGCIWLLTTL